MFKKMNIIKIFTITASIAFLVACDKNIENVDITEQQLYEVKLQSAEDYILANGEIASSDEFCVFPPYSGTVSMVFKSVGESVVKGEKLFTYNTKELEKNKSELQKQFEQIKSETEYTHSINVRNLENAEYQKELNCSEAQCEINNTEADRDRIDEKIAAVSEELDYIAQQIAEAFDKNPTDLEIQYQQKVTEIEDLNEEYLRAVREVENAYMKYDAVVRESDKIIQEMKDVINGEKYDDKVSEYEVQINEIQKKIDNAVVFFGADGIITEMNITLGCDIQDQVTLKIASPDSYVVLAHVNEENIENITIGMKSEISFVNNNNVFEGTVSKIYMVPDENQSTYPVEIDIDSNSNIFLGRSVSVKVYTEAKENIIMIPYDYLRKDNDGSVYVQKNSVNGAEEICVETGIKMVDKIEIISDTLKPGDKLIKFG